MEEICAAHCRWPSSAKPARATLRHAVVGLRWGSGICAVIRPVLAQLLLRCGIMRDPYWRAAWAAVEPHLVAEDSLLLPRGEWPVGSRQARFYDKTIRLDLANVLFLHKGKLGGIKKGLLRYILQRWDFLFANEVFVCFRKSMFLNVDARHNDDPHVCVLHEYLLSAERKRIGGTVYFIHLPKTAGTSVWKLLSQQVVSSIYYDNFESFLHNPPQAGEYDLVGGHIPLTFIMAQATPGDHIVGLVRDPAARFRSAFLHSRRAEEDPQTFTPIMQAMRSTPLCAFLETYDGAMELRQQLLMLGWDFIGSYDTDTDADLYGVAEARLADERYLFRPTCDIDSFVADLAGILEIDPASSALAYSNTSDPTVAVETIAEFDAALPIILAANRWERALYSFVVEASRQDAVRKRPE